MSLENPVVVNKDPTCGAEVDEKQDLFAERVGVFYYFCREARRRQFLSVPANFEWTRGQETE